MKRLLLPALLALAFLCWLLWPRGEPGLPGVKVERVKWECRKGREIDLWQDFQPRKKWKQ